MLDLDFDAACASESELIALSAYAKAEQAFAAARPQRSDDAGENVPQAAIWVSRRNEIEGVPGDQLAPIHGRLIALGLLNFQLQGREEGVVYRLSPEGRQALSMGAATVFSEEAALMSA